MGSRGGGRRRRGYGPTGFEEAGGYMAAKIAKLEHQYEDSVTADGEEERKGLFSGVAIFVNGYTEPTAEELKRVMMVHGGTYHHYYSRSKTTHIIANNLPDTKIKNMNTERIVSPKWITDSLSAGHLLDYTKYILYGHQSRSQPRLQFKAVPSPKKSVGESSGTMKQEPSSPEKRKLESCQKVVSSAMDDDSVEHNIKTERPDSKDTKAGAESESEQDKHTVTAPNAPSTSTSSSTFHKSPLKGHAMSTANPRFLTEFYSNSRLHHISTMGAMFKAYVNELQNKCDGFPGRDKLKSWLRSRNPSQDPPQPSGPPPKSKRVIMHIDMDCFFVSVGLRKHPELHDKPVAVTHARGNPQGQAREGMDRQYELNFYKQRAEKKLKAKIQAAGCKVTEMVKSDIKEAVDDAEDAEQTDRNPDKKFSTIHLIDETSSMSEIASCNYEARKAGVKNGMFLGPALKLCPSLQTIPYDFEGYKEVSYKLYDIVASFTHDIEAVSCDEMFVDLTELLHSCHVSPMDFTTYLRERVQKETGCPCSAGLGPNMLVARMATRLAKPNGQHWADPQDLTHHMKDHKVTELPGVGWSTGRQLEAEGLMTCGDLQQCSLSHLQTLFGPRTGQSLYNYCRGVDSRLVKSEHVRKSVSAEVNYGIRFTCHSDAYKFISELAAEVESRLLAIKMKGKCITLKLKIRAKDAPVETAKFMGHGVCDNIAKSASLNCATSSADVIERETLVLLKQIKSPPQDFRGVGIQVSRLEPECGAKPLGASIKSFLLAARQKSSSVGTNATGSPGAKISPVGTVSNLSREKNAVVTPAEGAEKSPDSPMKNFLLRAKRKTFEIGTSSTSAEDMDIHSTPESSMSKKENAAMAVVKSSSEHRPGHPGHDTGQPSDTGHVLPVSHTPTSTTNSNSNEAKSIDMEVLLALPEDMRDQVIAEYQQQGYIIPALPGGRGSKSSHRGSAAEAQPGTSGLLMPEESRRQEASNIIQPAAAADGPQTSFSDTARGNNSQLRGRDVHREVATNNQSAPLPVLEEASGFGEIGDATNSNSNFSAVSENAYDSPLITSFSQVDSSFLEAIPEELREELRQDLERRKQAREAAPPLPGARSVRGSLVGSGNGRGRGRGRPRGRRGRGSKADSRQVGEEGLVTLTSLILGNAEPQNFRIKKNISVGKKGCVPPEPQRPASAMSPSKEIKEEPKMDTMPYSPSAGTSELLPTSDERKEEQKIRAEVVPDLCGMRSLPDVKSVIQAWVASCACPEDEDADILGSYFTSLITHHDLEKLDCLIKYLYRTGISHNILDVYQWPYISPQENC
ncbi:DNA repair protein REV1-like isoform X2 [Eriocheir sinensis]|uniref:DNA repair protein REV1-like isoform X2 n=1 Tax=Eriocheir sinensis TaxID=95602 RepID=UPI0021C5CB57|nr:DNA repair protein REV1-like isoform X2 [Eriocheir sinensis]